MSRSAFLSVAVIAALAIAPAEQARANDALIGGIIGGAIGSAIANDVQRKRQTQRTTTVQRTYRAPAVSSAQREENRAVQHALNYFGFNAGGADGVLGPRSRQAISSYQAHLGYPVTGRLSPYEQQFLLTSHNRALVGGPATQSAIARAGGVTSGLLVAWRDEAMGGRSTAAAGASRYGGLPPEIAKSVDEIANSSDPTGEQLIQRAGFIQLADMNGDGQTDYLIDTSVTGSAFWCNAQNCAVRVFVSTPGGYERNDFQAFNVSPEMFNCQRGLCQISVATTATAVPAPVQQPPAPASIATAAAPEPEAGEGGMTGLPTFFARPATEASLASHCNTVSLVTTTNGGFTTLETMSDPNAALAEQFCLARTYAIANGEQLLSRVTGVAASEIEGQCNSLAQTLATATASLSLRDTTPIRQDVAELVLASGMAPTALADSARICLGVGYRTDDMDVALASALLLVVVGHEAYAELLGHHIGQGFGATKRQDRALAWYALSNDAIDRGVQPAFAPGQPERAALIKAATTRLATGETRPSALPATSAPTDTALPFSGLRVMEVDAPAE